MAREREMETRKIVSMPQWLAKAIEDYRFEERIQAEAEAIRQLIIRGLEAEGRTAKPPEKAD